MAIIERLVREDQLPVLYRVTAKAKEILTVSKATNTHYKVSGGSSKVWDLFYYLIGKG